MEQRVDQYSEKSTFVILPEQLIHLAFFDHRSLLNRWYRGPLFKHMTSQGDNWVLTGDVVPLGGAEGELSLHDVAQHDHLFAVPERRAPHQSDGTATRSQTAV